MHINYAIERLAGGGVVAVASDRWRQEWIDILELSAI